MPTHPEKMFSSEGAYADEDWSVSLEQVAKPDWHARDTAYFGAAQTMEIDTPSELANKYQQIYSDEIQGVAGEALAQQQAASLNMARMREREAFTDIMTDMTIPMGEKEKMLATWAARADERGDPELADAYRENVAVLAPVQNTDDAEHIEKHIEAMPAMEEYSSRVEAEMNTIGASLDPSIESATAGFLELAVPFVDTAARKAIQEAAFGEMGWWEAFKQFVFSGHSTEAFRERMQALPPAMREEAHLRMLEVIKNLPGADMKKWDLMRVHIQDPYAGWEKWIDTAVSMLDALIIPGVLLRGAKWAKRAFMPSLREKAPLKTALRGDPSHGSRLGAAILQDESLQLSRATDTNIQIMAEELIFPRPLSETLENVPPTMLNDIAMREQWARNVARSIDDDTRSAGVNYYDAEKAATVNEKMVEYEKFAKSNGAELHLNLSEIGVDSEGFKIVARHGRTTTAGFDSFMEAQKVGKRMFGPGQYKVTGFDPVKKELYDPSKGAREHGQFFVEVKEVHTFDPFDADVFGWQTAVGWLSRKAPTISKWMEYASARFDNTIRTGLFRAENLELSIEKRLLDNIRVELTNLKLSKKDKAAIFEIIRKGGVEGKTYRDFNELKALDLGGKVVKDWDKVAKGYYLYRNAQDMLWTLENRAFRKTLEKEGRKLLNVQGDAKWVRPLRYEEALSADNKGYIFDSLTNQVRKLKDGELDELYVKGGMIAESRGILRAGDNGATHVLIHRDIHLKDLPDNPLPYIDGYYNRGYETHFFVDRYNSKQLINGQSGRTVGDYSAEAPDINRTMTLETYGTAKEAQAAAARLNAKNAEEGTVYVARQGRELDAAYREEYQLFSDQSMHSRRRGAQALSSGQRGLDHEEMIDPIESLHASIRSVSRHLAWDDYLTSMERRWVNTFGNLTGGKFPAQVGEIATAKGVGTEAKEFRNAAVSLWDHIQYQRRAPILSERVTKQLTFGFANLIEGTKWTDKLAKVIRKSALKGGTPFTFMKRIPSLLFIWTRPARQILLQTGQLAQLSFLDPKLVMSGKIVKDPPLLAMYQWSWLNKRNAKYGIDDDALESLEKMLVKGGVADNVEELRALREAFFDKSGLPGSQDANTLIEGFLRDFDKQIKPWGMKSAGQKAVDLIKSPVKGLRKVGFDAGEYMNLAGSWLYARRKWMRENPGKQWNSKAGVEQISSMAREVSYAMTRAGSFGYQRGAMGVLLQFLSVPHKAMMQMLPALSWKGKPIIPVGSKIWTPAESRKILAANMTLFGGYTFGAYKAFEAGMEHFGLDPTEIPEEVHKIMRGGITDLAGNYFFKMMFDEQELPDIEFARAFSPVGEKVIPFTETVVSMFEKPLAEAWLGPFGTALRPSENFFSAMKHGNFDVMFAGRLAETAGLFNSMLHSPHIDTPREHAMAFDAGLKMFSGWSDYWKARYIWQNERLISSRGFLGATTDTPKSDAAAALLGFGTAAGRRNWEESLDFRDEEKHIKSLVKWYVDQSKNILRTWEANGYQGDDGLELRRMGISTMNMLFEDRPDLRRMFMDELSKQLAFDYEKGGDNFIRVLLDQITLGGEIAARTANDLQGMVHDGLIDQPTADALMEMYKYSFDTSKLERDED